MKNFLVFAIFTALVFVVSCGGGSSSDNNSVANFGKLGQECYPNKSCDEGLLCEEETNRCIEDPENPSNSDNENSDNDSIENNDSNPVEENDKDDQPIDNNDSDDIIDDKDDSDVNDNDPINHNDSDDTIDDNDDNPSEHDDTDDSRFYASYDLVLTKKQQENLSEDEINAYIQSAHNQAKSLCPYNYSQNPEYYYKGHLFVTDSCKGDVSWSMWLEGFVYRMITTLGFPPSLSHRVTSITFNYSNKGSPTNMKLSLPHVVMDIDFVSQSCLSQIDLEEDTSKIVSDFRGHCYVNGKDKALPIETKGIKQTKSILSQYVSLCQSMPNYELDEYNNSCSTTINEFVWLENVTHKILEKNTMADYKVDSVERNLDTGVFYMDITLGGDPDTAMNLHITLNNAKSCIDQCHGKEGCTSHIEPTRQDASKGCFINGVEVNGEE